MKWACLATPLLLLGLVTARQVEVEDVTARQLEAATQTEDVLAVFWCKYTAPETQQDSIPSFFRKVYWMRPVIYIG
jgi:hypothetical protein